MRTTLGAVGLALTLCVGCGYRLHDVSTDPVPEPVPLGRRIPAGAICSAVAWVGEVNRGELLGLIAAEELAYALRRAGVFQRAEAALPDAWPHQDEVMVRLIEEVRTSPTDHSGRQTLTILSMLPLPTVALLPLAIPLDFIYMEIGPSLVADYALECRDAGGRLLIRLETRATIVTEEQGLSSAGGAAARKLARDRSILTLVRRLVLDQGAHERIAAAVCR